MNRRAPVTLNAEFTFNSTFDVPDQIMVKSTYKQDIEKQRDIVRTAYSQYGRDEDKPDYDREFECLQFMTRWYSHLSEINSRGRDPRQESNFVRYHAPFHEITLC